MGEPAADWMRDLAFPLRVRTADRCRAITLVHGLHVQAAIAPPRHYRQHCFPFSPGNAALRVSDSVLTTLALGRNLGSHNGGCLSVSFLQGGRILQRATPRFNIGQRVRINTTISSRYSGQEGLVVAVKQSRHGKPNTTSLDKYTVAFSNGDQAEFFDIQLVLADVPSG